VSILLARWLSPSDYGAFTLVYSVFALVSTLHSGLIAEPMLVFGSGRHARHQRKYLHVVLRFHWMFALGLSAILALAAVASLGLASSSVAAAFFGLAVAAPFMLYRYTGRSATYMILNPRLAAIAATIYMGTMLPGVFALYRIGYLSLTTALFLMGLASLGSGLWLFRRLKPERVPQGGTPSNQEVLHQHLGYGRWAVTTGILSWLPGQAYYLALPVWAGLEATAQLRAVLNLIMPVSHGFAAIGVLLVSALVRFRDHPRFRHLVLGGMVFFTALASVYWLLLGLYHQPIMLWLYDGQYLAYDRVPWILGLVPVVYGSVTVLGAALRGLERPDTVFWAYAAASLVTVTLGIGLMIRYGLEGAAWGMVAASATTTLTMSWFFFVKRVAQS
jgi:O-antigen/teichoic acid export membrane protein